MSLAPGHRLAHYEILEPIGKGGMGEVYRARDGKLGREVAIKVLPDEFSQDKERLARFKREAKVLASLNHPNIAAIYGLEQAGRTHYLVLELVEGETLAERLARGPIPLDEAREIAVKIADALEEAHEHGIVHRDLKPANIKLTPDDNVKVLDFGLAKAFAEDTRAPDSSSPTITRDGTRVGVILGTAAYMSPEQARGKRVDKRTDIFAFGAVVYEMLTARKAFPGGDVSEILASVIKLEPGWNALPSDTPTTTRQLLERCLRKDPKSRLRDIGDARIELEEGSTRRAIVETRSGSKLAAFVVAMAAAAGLGAFLTWLANPGTSLGDNPVVRATLELPADYRLGNFSSVAIAPDGQRVVFVAVDDEGSTLLMQRTLDEFESKPITGTEGARAPFFSPDGEQVGFSVGGAITGSLMKIALAGGVRISICNDCRGIVGATWGQDDTIVFQGQHQGLARISADGGAVETLTAPDRTVGDEFHVWPRWLPDGSGILFTMRTAEGSILALYSLASEEVDALDMAGGGSQALYVATGHIVYVQNRQLLAMPFDLERRESLGPPVSIVDGLRERLIHGLGIVNFDISGTGSLVYAVGASEIGGRTMVWVDRNGVASPITTETGDYRWPSLSPDGTRIAYTDREDTAIPNVWILDLERGTKTRFTTVESGNVMPAWSPDGTKILFSSTRLGPMDLFWKPTVRTGDAEPVLELRAQRFPGSWSPDNETIAFESNMSVSTDISLATLGGTEEPFLASSFYEGDPRFSPDGRWLAYLSDASGQREVYVTSYPEADQNTIVSSEGATHVEWSTDGSELFYLTGDALMVAEVSSGPALRVGKPRKLFDWSGLLQSASFDVSPDGQRFVMIRAEDAASETKLRLVQNWFHELKASGPNVE